MSKSQCEIIVIIQEHLQIILKSIFDLKNHNFQSANSEIVLCNTATPSLNLRLISLSRQCYLSWKVIFISISLRVFTCLDWVSLMQKKVRSTYRFSLLWSHLDKTDALIVSTKNFVFILSACVPVFSLAFVTVFTTRLHAWHLVLRTVQISVLILIGLNWFWQFENFQG